MGNSSQFPPKLQLFTWKLTLNPPKSPIIWLDISPKSPKPPAVHLKINPNSLKNPKYLSWTEHTDPWEVTVWKLNQPFTELQPQFQGFNQELPSVPTPQSIPCSQIWDEFPEFLGSRSYLPARAWGAPQGAVPACRGELLRVRAGACWAPLFLEIPKNWAEKGKKTGKSHEDADSWGRFPAGRLVHSG